MEWNNDFNVDNTDVVSVTVLTKEKSKDEDGKFIMFKRSSMVFFSFYTEQGSGNGKTDRGSNSIL